MGQDLSQQENSHPYLKREAHESLSVQPMKG